MRRFCMSFITVFALSTMVAAGATGWANARSPGDALRSFRGPEGAIWVGDRANPMVGPELVAFDSETGEPSLEIDLDAPASDVAFGKGKVFVGEEALARIAVIDAESGDILHRIATGPLPHHLTASRGGAFIAYSAFGTNRLGVIDARKGSFVGEWAATSEPAARTHAAAFSPNGRLIYAASEPGIISTLDARTGKLLKEVVVPGAHELIVSGSGRRMYVAARSLDLLHVIDLRSWAILESLPLSRPDTLQLAQHDRMLTVGLRTSPARIAVVDVRTMTSTEVTIATGPTSLAGHQWTSRDGRFTYAAFEGAVPGLAIVIHRTNAVMTIPYPGGGRPHGLDFSRVEVE